jgi:hypothetical protein
VGVDEGDYFFCRRSSSAPKKVAAACKMSLERRSSFTSLRSSFSSACSVVVSPARAPKSISDCLTQARSDSDPELAGHPRDHRAVARVLLAELFDHADGPLLQRSRVPLRCGLLVHDSILASKVWSLQENQAGSNRAFGRMEALHPEEPISEAVDPAAAAQVRGREHPRELESPRQTSRVGGDRMGALSSIQHGRRPRCPVLAIESDSSPRR